MTTCCTTEREKLVNDLKVILTDSEELLNATAGQAGDKIESARSKVEEAIRHTKDRIMDIEQAATEKVKTAAKATDQYVHDNPWPAIGISAGVGLALGWLLGRK